MVSIGDIVEGKIVSIMAFGVFIEWDKKESGLVHISEGHKRAFEKRSDCKG